jgi:aquaporin Z
MQPPQQPALPQPLRPDPLTSQSAASPQAARGGVHLVEWACEAAGTALLLLAGLSAVCFDFGPDSPLRHFSTSPKLLVTGLLFAGSGSLIAISPLGRRSGAHLNPVVTLAFWTQGKVHRHDVAGYIVSQLAGAVLGTAVVALLWRSQATAIHFGATTPGHGINDFEAVIVEAAMTAILVLAILLLTSGSAARWTPLVLWPLIAVLVWQGAPYTGTSLNPARSLGPALLAPQLRPYWIYVIGPLAGGALAVAAFGLWPRRRVLTAKLFHDPAYPSTLASTMPVAQPAVK